MKPSKLTFLLSELKEVAQGRESQRRVLQRVQKKLRGRDGTELNFPVRQKRTIEELLELFHAKQSLNASGCIEWTGGVNKRGYGVTTFNGKALLVHRLAYMIANLEDPYPLCVCHICDNRKCVNPEHFFLGTDQDNSDDKISKGREKFNFALPGEQHPQAKLTESKVIAIREKWLAGGVSKLRLAREFGVCHGTIRQIIAGRTWKHVVLSRSSPE